MKRLILLSWWICLSWVCWTQPVQQMVRVSVVPDSDTWIYALGEDVNFAITVTKNGIPLKGVRLKYELSQDMMEPFKCETIVLNQGTVVVNGGSLSTSGFLRCRALAEIGGKLYEGRCTVGYEPQSIKPATVMPPDFREFWEKAKSKNAEIPMDACLRLLPDRCTSKVDVYELSVQSFRYGSRMYGILCVPKGGGKYPALLRVPGAGVRPYEGHIAEAERGYITLDMGIHGIPVTMPPLIYQDLRNGALDNYWNFNWDDPDAVYYKRVYMGCIRMVDYICSMSVFNGDLIVYGGSQGGLLSLVTAALDDRVKGCVVFHPALADVNGYLHGRAGGWPHYFKGKNGLDDVTRKEEESIAYYDAVNFARILDKPVFMSFGYNDMVCPPTTSYAVYNSIWSEKTLVPVPETEHYAYPETWEEAWDWGENLLNGKNK